MDARHRVYTWARQRRDRSAGHDELWLSHRYRIAANFAIGMIRARGQPFLKAVAKRGNNRDERRSVSRAPAAATVPRDYNFAAGILKRNLDAGRADKIAFIDHRGKYI